MNAEEFQRVQAIGALEGRTLTAEDVTAFQVEYVQRRHLANTVKWLTVIVIVQFLYIWLR